uniref:PPM-type phosphatase domain-containing protein n=1 Tax=Timema douglasi TaxID=61478 RepID=A0A7R8Z6S3_TIMDO|nr:unnamed protein product [Timema douglasi]
MAIGYIAQHLISNKHLSHCAAQCSKRTEFIFKQKLVGAQTNSKDPSHILTLCRAFHCSNKVNGYPRLTPLEVNSILRANEFTKEFSTPGSIKSYDSNQLSSNNPIEDTRLEAQCLLTTGMLLGVFDGHGGPSCAHVVAKRLLQYIAACLLPPDVLSKYLQSMENNEDIMILKTYNDQIDLVDELKELYKTNFRKFVKELSETKSQREFQMKEAMEQAFLRLDDDISREALTKQDTGPEINLKTLSVTMSGAVACVVHIDGPHLHVASVGDCQAVLGVLTDVNTWMAKKLSIEHNTDNSAEVNRILAEHPSNERDTIIRMDRLLGQLAPLRALGDQRYKWSKATLNEVAVPYFGEKTIPPNYYTPPYLTARPDVTQHRLTPRDKFLVIASDGLWDMVSPLQVVRLVGEHMSGKVTLNPFKLPRKNMRIADINKLLLQRKEGLKKKPIDTNAATHLLRNALGGTEYGIDHGKLSHLLSMPDELVRLFRDDITVTVVYFDSEYLRHSPA